MGVESGGTGYAFPQSRNQRGTEDLLYLLYILIFNIFLLGTYLNFIFSNIFKIKWLKCEEKLNFWGRRVWVPGPMNLSTPPPPTPTPHNQNFLATPMVIASWFTWLAWLHLASPGSNASLKRDREGSFSLSCFLYSVQLRIGPRLYRIILHS